MVFCSYLPLVSSWDILKAHSLRWGLKIFKNILKSPSRISFLQAIVCIWQEDDLALVTLTFLLQHSLDGVKTNSIMQSTVINGRTCAYYFVNPTMKNKIPSVFTGNTYKVPNTVLGKHLFGMQIKQTGLGWFLKNQFAWLSQCKGWFLSTRSSLPF